MSWPGDTPLPAAVARGGLKAVECYRELSECCATLCSPESHCHNFCLRENAIIPFTKYSIDCIAWPKDAESGIRSLKYVTTWIAYIQRVADIGIDITRKARTDQGEKDRHHHSLMLFIYLSFISYILPSFIFFFPIRSCRLTFSISNGCELMSSLQQADLREKVPLSSNRSPVTLERRRVSKAQISSVKGCISKPQSPSTGDVFQRLKSIWKGTCF
jgi:hypothetical protein